MLCMELMPLWIVAAIAFLYGSVIGSFSAVVVCRMHTGKSLNTRSRCLSCGRTLSWYELVPVLSFLVLRGKCRTCSARIPLRDFAVETLLGVTYAAIVLIVPDLVEALLLMLFATVLAIITAYDLRHLIIPDELVLLATGIAVLLLGYQLWPISDSTVILGSVAGGGIAFLAFASLWFVSAGRWMGFGDAKLAVPLGMLVGLSGVFSLIVLSFWVGAVITLAVVLYERLASGGQGRLRFKGAPLKMKSEVPFAPFLVIAFALVYLFGADVLSLTSYALGT